MTLKISHSGMSCYRECPHKYYLSRVEGIRPVKVSRALRFGSAMHKALEIIWGGGDSPLLEEWPNIAAKYELDMEDQILGRLLLVGYSKMYLIPEGADVECHFENEVVSPGGEVEEFTFQGFIDVETPGYIMDHKTTATNITPTYLKDLHRNPQAEEYLISAQDRGSEASYAVWDIIKSNRVTRRLKTPEHEQEFYKRKGKYGNVGDPKPGTYLEDETWGEYEARIVEDIAGNPEGYYVREELHKTEDELDRRRYDIWATGVMISQSISLGAFPRNEQGCSKYGGCEYQPICWEGVDPAGSELYTIKKKEA